MNDFKFAKHAQHIFINKFVNILLILTNIREKKCVISGKLKTKLQKQKKITEILVSVSVNIV